MTGKPNEYLDNFNPIVSLAKRRGFIFPASEIYGGVGSTWDYGPLGVELKRNVKESWWNSMVHSRDDIVGLDSAIIQNPKVWEASGHIDGFSDPLVECKNCHQRFRADHVDTEQCPSCGVKGQFTPPRQFNLMFRTQLGPVDVLNRISKFMEDNRDADSKDIREGVDNIVKKSAVYLRPETAQAMFVQFLNCQQSMSMKVPFGIAQMGKSFRNEVTVEHFIFRSCEFEQMEMEFFVEPGSQKEWLDYWRDRRMEWWQKLSNDPSKFRYRAHEKDELAHYADACYDIEYEYPWGFDELEGVASRTDYDLKKHAEHSGAKLSYFDQQKQDPETGKNGWRYTPYVIEPAAGATRGLLVYLLDAYHEERVPDADGNESSRVVMKLHPRLAPIKVAVLPLSRNEKLVPKAREVHDIVKANFVSQYDDSQSIGRRYRRQDEIGTPLAVTIDFKTVEEDNSVTIRDRDSMVQDRVPIPSLLEALKDKIENLSLGK